MGGFDFASAALGFMGSLLDWQSSSDANAANRAIANETNQYNASIARANREYDREVRATDWWHYLQTDQEAYRRFLENREYESVGAQAERLRAAGINPALAAGVGALGHSSAGSPPSAGSVPSGHGGETAPFAQTGAPVQPAMIGSGIRDSVRIALESMAQEREDYRLASDITFQDYKNRMDVLEYALHKTHNESEVSYFNKKIRDLEMQWKYQQDDWLLRVENFNFMKEVQNYQLQQKDFELELQQYATESKMAVDRATSAMLFAQKNTLMEEARQMKQRGDDEHKINEWLDKKESAIYDRIVAENKEELDQLNFNNRNWYMRNMRRIVKWSLEPIRGVLSVGLGGNVSSSTINK